MLKPPNLGDPGDLGPIRPPADTDGDRLSDRAEVGWIGTDPTKRDTDGDGLGDGDEVLVYGTNPKDPDSDGDGADDGWEAVLVPGMDPWNPDVDGDGLLDGEELSTANLSAPRDRRLQPPDYSDFGLKDTDGDGWDDLAEKNKGTERNNPGSHPRNPPGHRT